MKGVERYDYGKVIGIFMGAVWAYDFFWLFWGPEMKQWERNEEAEKALEYERWRVEGLSLREIGGRRAKDGLKDEPEGEVMRDVENRVGMNEEGREKERSAMTEHSENV